MIEGLNLSIMLASAIIRYEVIDWEACQVRWIDKTLGWTGQDFDSTLEFIEQEIKFEDKGEIAQDQQQEQKAQINQKIQELRGALSTELKLRI